MDAEVAVPVSKYYPSIQLEGPRKPIKDPVLIPSILGDR
jgi:hypothetical protein